MYSFFAEFILVLYDYNFCFYVVSIWDSYLIKYLLAVLIGHFRQQVGYAISCWPMIVCFVAVEVVLVAEVIE